MDKTKLKPGALLEFYTEFSENEAYYVDKTWSNKLNEIASLPEIALNQVRQNKYAEAIHQEGYQTVYAVGVGFCKKTCEVAIEEM